MKKFFIIVFSILASVAMANADCWIGGTYTLDVNATAAELRMLPDDTSVIVLSVPPAQFLHTFAGISDLTGKTFLIRQTFPGGVTNDGTPIAPNSVIPASIDHILSGCQ